MNIFDKPYYPLHYFSYEIFVKCPKCNGHGKITSSEDGQYFKRNEAAKFNCLDCGHISDSNKQWLGYYVGYLGLDYKGRACQHCGSKFQKEFERTKEPYLLAEPTEVAT